MNAFSWMRARPRTLASAAGVTAGVIAIATLALTYDGNPTTKVDLNDGGVWITKSSSLMVGHFNNESTVLDGGLRTSGENFDILQDASTILVVDNSSSTLTAVDPARVSLTDAATIPGSAKIALGNKTAAILDSSSGDLWIQPVTGLAGFEIQATKPFLELGKDADVAVGQDGTVYAVSAEKREIITVPVDNQGEALEPATSALSDLSQDTTPTITVVGTTPVVLDPAAGAILTPGGLQTELDGADGAVLQQASAQTDAVAVATTSQLLRVPLDGGDVQSTSSDGQGVPAQPVSLLGCTYGAWAGSGKFVRECPADANDVVADIPDADKSAQMTFRVNRDVIILNDTVSGAAWLADESLQQVDNWNDLTPPEGDTENQEESTEETVETTLPERSAINTPPVAEDDSFGVRPGQTTFLPVVDNDNDADGDVLVASLAEKQPSIGTVQAIQNGGSLQIAVGEEASGSATFSYVVKDGRGGEDTATVSLDVHDWKINGAPTQKRTTTLAVENGGTISYNILPDWIDPDGDDIYLKGVAAAPGDEVDFSTDGQITYRAVASLQGRKQVEITVADGLGEVATGTLTLDVRPSGSTLPKTNADHVVTRVGQQVTVAPLTNDSSSGREALRLARVDVDEVDGATIVPDYPNKTFSFTSATAGVYYVQYLVSAGPNAVPGLVRVDVLDEAQEDLPPVAVRDVALLPTGGEVLLGILNNDTDPSGGILVVQSVTVEPGSGISVSVLNHETLRIGDQGSLAEQVRITYRISNGSKTAEGDVIVIPIPAPEKLLPPVANDDQVTVRAGDVVTIPVLNNDTHPNGDALHVAPDLIEPFVDPLDGEAFVSQDTVRFKAGDEAKTVYATYEAVGTDGQKDAGYITIQVLPINEETNAAPRPQDVTARALSGSTVNIAIPLDGIDADGDSVELLGLDSAPKKGRLVDVGQNYLVYEAFADSQGVDTFTYRVRDHLGKEGTATVRVGIAAGENVNQAPYAVKDSVVVRPGREVAVPVTENDSDPEGDSIVLVKDGIILPDVNGLKARVSGDRVIVEVPDRELETSLQYTIRDDKGATASATLQITVDNDVPLLPPIARDDRVKPADLTDGLTIDYNVLENDEDPDGTTEALKIAVDDGGTVTNDRHIRLTVGDEAQLIRYTLTDRDGLEASAFIFVPSIKQMRPTLSVTKPVEVVSGETKELVLDDYVTVAGGGSVVVTEASKVSAVHNDGASLIKDERTLVYTSAPGFFGEDGLTVEVTDGTGPDDPDGRKATVTIPIKVLPPKNQQPTFVGGEMNVAPGEDATTLDLAALTSDPDADDAGKHTYSLLGSPGKGLTARIVDNSTLQVEAGSDTAKGTAATLTIRISDGTTDPIEGTVNVTVTASTRELATANTDTIAEADQGEKLSVPVLENDTNPFPETPLKLVAAVTETGDGIATVDGNNVIVTPGAKFVGTMVVRYRIQDATKDVDREVNGQVIVTVQGVPEAPGTPVVSSVQDRKVVLSWSPPANNGAEITGYTVKSVQGSAYTKQCSSTTCTLDGLTNNVEYVFQVTATNRVGDSEPSSSSEMARPDARPDTPLPPTLVFGDKSLDVKWTTPTTPGSPVESYNLRISPAPPSGAAEKTGVTGNSLVWSGLENGTDYQVQVQAVNRAPEPSTWSGWSASEIPAGPPGTQPAPTAQSAPSVGSQAQMQVSWVAAEQNGAAISNYELRVMRGGTVVDTITVAGGQLTQAVTVATSSTDYTFSVRAKNKAGWGEPSAASNPQRAFGSPGAPTITETKENDGSLYVNYTLADGNGASGSELRYEYSLNSGGWVRNWDGHNIPAANNGSYTVSVRAYSVVGGQESQPGAASAATAALRPYGPVGTPGVNATKNGKSVQVSWSAPAPNGRAITVMQISIDGGSWQNVGASGSQNVGNGYSQTHSISVRAQDEAAQWSATASASATSESEPVEVVTTKKGASGYWPVGWGGSGSCTHSSCAYVMLHVENFKSPGSYRLYCNDGGQWGGNTYDVPVNGDVQLSCFTGTPGAQIRVYIEQLDRYSAPLTWY